MPSLGNRASCAVPRGVGVPPAAVSRTESVAPGVIRPAGMYRLNVEPSVFSTDAATGVSAAVTSDGEPPEVTTASAVTGAAVQPCPGVTYTRTSASRPATIEAFLCATACPFAKSGTFTAWKSATSVIAR